MPVKDISPLTQPVFRRKDPTPQPDVSLFGALLNLVPEAALIVHRIQGNVFAANAAFSRLTAYSSKEVNQQPLSNVLAGFDLGAVSSGETHQAQLSRRQREALPVFATASSLDVTGFWLVITLLPQEDDRPDPDSFYEKVLKTISELFVAYDAETTQQALAIVTSALRSLLETDLIAVYQADGGYPRFNKIATQEVLSVLPDVLPWNDLSHRDEDPVWAPGRRVTTELQRAARVANLHYLVTIPLGEPGAIFGALAIGDARHKPSERLRRIWTLIGQAITQLIEHLLVVRTLRHQVQDWESHRLIRDAAFDHVRIALLVVSPEQTILEMNPAAEQMLGYSNGEALHQPVHAVLISTDRIGPVLDAAVRGVVAPMGQFTLHRRSGQSFPAHLQVTPVSKDGSVQAAIITVHDVSEYEEIRARTEQLEQRSLIGEYTAMFAHEVRNPINNISLALQLVASRLDESDPNQDTIASMEQDCNRLNHLMEELLAFSKPMTPKNELVQLAPLCQRILDRWRPRMARKSVECFFKCEENLPMVRGDGRALDQVFNNLITNAIEAMGERGGGALAVAAQVNRQVAGPPQIEVTVSDNGPGIPDEVREHVFEPFVTTKKTGTGLGLAITKRIVTAHRGTITVNSFPGGTVFHVLLPIAEE